MNVAELITHLKTMDPAANVVFLYDGFCTPDVGHVWMSRAGEVVLTGRGHDVDATQNRPAGAPTAEAVEFWSPGD